MEIYTIGFTKKNAAQFFGALKRAGIRRLVDIRLNNTSQIAGFAKKDNLAYFLKELCGIEYVHEPLLAPTKEILSDYKKKKIGWDEYERRFDGLMRERQVEKSVNKELFAVPTVLLCSEPKADKCHRRLVVEYLRKKWRGIEVIHL